MLAARSAAVKARRLEIDRTALKTTVYETGSDSRQASREM
jgi:hypothetical protein